MGGKKRDGNIKGEIAVGCRSKISEILVAAMISVGVWMQQDGQKRSWRQKDITPNQLSSQHN